MSTTNRREFLKVAASVGASTVVADAAQLRTGSEAPPGRVRAWRTTKDQKFQSIEAPQWETGSGTSPLSVHLDPGKRYQEVLGFGGAFTDASCYLMHQMSAEARHSLLAELYGPAGLQLSVGRTCIGSSDYSTELYNYDESPDPDPELKLFSIDHDRTWLLPTLREAREINPDLFLFSCVWSPPGWMKTGGSMWGGSMRKHWFAPHAQYFVKFLQAYAAAGVKIQCVTVNNEVDTDQDGHFPATLWGQEYEMDFVRDHLGPALEQASLDTKIWILDHNYSLWGRAADELSDPRVSKYVDGVAWHSYAGTPDAMSRVHDMFPAKHMYFTEGGPTLLDFWEGKPPRSAFPPTGRTGRDGLAPSRTCFAIGPDAFASGTFSWMRTAGLISPSRRVLPGPAASSVLIPSLSNSPAAGVTLPSLITPKRFKEARTFSPLRATCPASITLRPRMRMAAACW